MVVLNLMIFVQLVIIYPIRLSWWEGPCFVWRGDSQGQDLYFFLYFFSFTTCNLYFSRSTNIWFYFCHDSDCPTIPDIYPHRHPRFTLFRNLTKAVNTKYYGQHIMTSTGLLINAVVWPTRPNPVTHIIIRSYTITNPIGTEYEDFLVTKF